MEDIRNFGAMFKSDLPSKFGTLLAVVYMTLFAIVVAVAQDIAVLSGQCY